MAQIHWASAVDGYFGTASNWTGGVAPGPSNDAFLDASGKRNYVVTVSGTTWISVHSIATAGNATLEIAVNSGFVASAGTGLLAARGANSGTIVLDGYGSVLDVAGTFNNPGSVVVGAGSLALGSNLTLYDAGIVELAGGFIQSFGGPMATLTNAGNTIEGFGNLVEVGYNGGYALVNEAKGVVDATGASAPLVIDAGSQPVINAGLFEASGAAGLQIRSGTIDDSAGGMILARSGSMVMLGSADIIGGFLKTTGTGVIGLLGVGLPQFDGTRFAVQNEGRILINDGQVLGIEGQIVNSGRIGVAGAGDPTTLRILPSGVTLSGGGAITLNSRLSEITGLSPSAVLDNVDNTISGRGLLGARNLTLINGAAGVITGTRSTGLVIDTGNNVITNAGLIVAEAGGAVTIKSGVYNTGVLEAMGGTLTLDGDVNGIGGVGGGVVDGGTLAVMSRFFEGITFGANGGTLVLAHARSYFGDISGFATGGGTVLDLRDIGFVGTGEATFSGAAGFGRLTVTDGTHTATLDLVGGDYTTTTFVASSDGQGGTLVIAAAASAHAFVAAMAGLSRSAGGSVHSTESWVGREAALFKPRSVAL